MKKSNVVILTIILIIFIGFGFILYSRLAEKNQREADLKKSKPLITYVSIIRPLKDKIVDSISVSSTVIPQDSFDISSKVNGKIISFDLKEGDKVNKGQIIATIDQEDLNIQIIQAKAQINISKANLALLQNGPLKEQIVQSETQINQIKANLEQTQISLIQAENDYQRFKKLFDSEAITKEQLEKSKTQVDSIKKQIKNINEQVNFARSSSKITKLGNRVEQIKSAKASLENSQASLKALEIQTKNYTLISQKSGFITKKNISQGNTISSGQVLLSLSSSDNPELEINLPQKYLSNVKLGQIILIESDIFSDKKQLKAKIKKIYPIIDMNNHLVKITATPLNKIDFLRQGMTFEANIITSVKLKTLTLPIQAILESDSKKYVYLLKDKRAEQHFIKTGSQTPEIVEVTEGLKGNENVILDGNSFIKSGDSVEVEKEVK